MRSTCVTYMRLPVLHVGCENALISSNASCHLDAFAFRSVSCGCLCAGGAYSAQGHLLQLQLELLGCQRMFLDITCMHLQSLKLSYERKSCRRCQPRSGALSRAAARIARVLSASWYTQQCMTGAPPILQCSLTFPAATYAVLPASLHQQDSECRDVDSRIAVKV